jgi:hypothetical protein
MSLKTRVSIQEKTVTYDDEGMPSMTWLTIEELEGTLLPYGNKLALQDYGFAEEVRFRFFFKGSNSNLKIGNRMLYGIIGLPIVYVADYKKAMDVLLNSSAEQRNTISG